MKALVSVSILAASLLAGGPSLAQGLGANSDAPVDITADELEVQNNLCISIWRGSAEALQDKARLRADVLTAQFQTKGGQPAASGGSNCGDLLSLEAKGNVYYVSSDSNRARGDAAFYDVSKDSITMTGDVIAVQGQNVLRGAKMVFNTKTGEGQMQGQSTGRNKSGRVRGVFYPSQNDGQKQ